MSGDTGPQPPGPRRRWRLLLALGLLVGSIVWVVAVVATLGRAAIDLRDARTSLRAAEAELRSADLSEARDHLDDAHAEATSASRRLGAVHVWPLRAVPFAAPNLRAVTALSDAARDVTGAAGELLGVASGIVHDDREAVPGEVSIAYLQELAPALRRLADTLATSTVRVEETGHARLVGPLARVRDDYLALASPLVDRTAIGARMAEAMPAFLGADGPRSYLVAAASLSELRGGGGLIGSWSVLTADDGHLSFASFEDIGVIERTFDDAAVAAPSAEYAERYRRYGGLRFWRNANLSAHFPWTAEVLLALWEADGRPPLDGVILTDPVVIEAVVERSGPVEVADVTTLTADTVRSFVGLDAYAVFDDDEERKRVLGAAATASFERMIELLDDADVVATVETLVALADSGHLQVYARDEQVQQALVEASVAGALDSRPGEFAAVVVNNVAANKVDYFTERDVEHRVTLAPDGVTHGEVTVRFDNTAPRDGLPRHVLGPWVGALDAGDNLSNVTFLCGPGCEVVDSSQPVTALGTEVGHPAHDLRVAVPAGERLGLRFVTRTDGAWTTRPDGSIGLTVRHRSQPTIARASLRLVIDVPADHDVVAAPDGAEVHDGAIVLEFDAPPADLSVEVRFAPPDAA